MLKAKVGDIHLYYEEHGQGESLLLIMGLGASTLSWSEQIPSSATSFGSSPSITAALAAATSPPCATASHSSPTTLPA